MNVFPPTTKQLLGRSSHEMFHFRDLHRSSQHTSLTPDVSARHNNLPESSYTRSKPGYDHFPQNTMILSGWYSKPTLPISLIDPGDDDGAVAADNK